MSGMSSEGIAPTDGRYGFVVFFRVLSTSISQPRIESYLPQIYSLTRLSTLMAVVLNMVGFDTTIPINCQVGPVSHLQSIILSN